MQFWNRILTRKSVFFVSFLSLKTVGKYFRSLWKVLEFWTNLPLRTLYQQSEEVAASKESVKGIKNIVMCGIGNRYWWNFH